MRIRELQKHLEELIFVGQAHRIGIIKELHQRPDTYEGIAKRMNFDARSTWVLLEALAEMSYLTIDNGVYSVPHEIYERLVDEGGQDYEGDFWLFLLYLINPWKTLPYVLKHGEPDKSSYKNFSISDFIKGMDSPWKKRIAPEVVNICLENLPEAKIVADIGGAPGTIAKVFAQRGINTIVYDLPESMQVMADELSRITNIEVQTGDATKELPKGPYDIAFLGNLCHGQSPEDNVRIIEMCYKHLHDKGLIVIFDNLRGESYRGATLALHMITQSPKGDVYSREEYYEWLKGTGFRDLRVENLSDSTWQLIIGRK
ncbi:MAG: methyltransferase [Spirochaetota bacterium]|nr:methyltransferase [Spirochaetota bacterium]